MIGNRSGRNRQKGITMWGIMTIVAVGVFFLFLFFKMFPPYLEDAQISSVLSNFASSSGARNKVPAQVIESIERRFDIEGVKNVTRRDIKIVPEGNSYAVEVDYFVEIPMFGNVSVMIDFEHRVIPH